MSHFRYRMMNQTGLFSLLCSASDGSDDGGGGGGSGGADGADGGSDGGDDGATGGRKSIAAHAREAAGGGKDGGSDGGDGGGDGGGDAPKFGDFDTSVLPSNLRGETAEETLAKIFPAWKGLRDSMAQQSKAPANATDYEPIELSENAKGLMGDLSQDPAMQIAAKVAHASGLSQEQYQQVVGGMIEAFGDAGMIVPLATPAEEIEKLGGDEQALKLGTQAETFIETLARAQGAPDGLKKELTMLSMTAEGVKTLNWIENQLGEKTTTITDNPGGGATTKEDVLKMMQDDRYDTESPKYDKKFRAQVDQLGAQLFN